MTTPTLTELIAIAAKLQAAARAERAALKAAYGIVDKK